MVFLSGSGSSFRVKLCHRFSCRSNLILIFFELFFFPCSDFSFSNITLFFFFFFSGGGRTLTKLTPPHHLTHSTPGVSWFFLKKSKTKIKSDPPVGIHHSLHPHHSPPLKPTPLQWSRCSCNICTHMHAHWVRPKKFLYGKVTKKQKGISMRYL